MKLYTSQMSSSARRVNLTVAHLGITIDQKLVDLRKEVDRAELGAVNPNRKIPVVADPATGLALWESRAIMQYRMVGKMLTLADYSIVATLMYRAPTQLPLDAYQHVLAYVARVEAQDAWKATEPPKWG